MADYYSLLSRAVANLPKPSPASSRKAIYERARKALSNQLRSLKPPLPESDITREETALQAAISRLEAEFEPVAAAPPAASEPSPPPPSAPESARPRPRLPGLSPRRRRLRDRQRPCRIGRRLHRRFGRKALRRLPAPSRLRYPLHRRSRRARRRPASCIRASPRPLRARPRQPYMRRRPTRAPLPPPRPFQPKLDRCSRMRRLRRLGKAFEPPRRRCSPPVQTTLTSPRSRSAL